MCSNMNLDINTVISIVSVAISLAVVIVTIAYNHKEIKLKKLQLAYEHKLSCYAGLISIYTRKYSSDVEELDKEFQIYMEQSTLLCSKETYTALINLYTTYTNNGLLSEDFANAYNVCIKAMRKVLGNPI